MSLEIIRLNPDAKKIAKSIYENNEDLMTALPKHCILNGKPIPQLMLIVIEEHAKLNPDTPLDQIETNKQKVIELYF